MNTTPYYRPWRYVAKRTRDPQHPLSVTVKHDDGNRYPLPHIARHSPDGFEMGYCGSGPADLALSILVHYFQMFGKSREEAIALAEPLHQEFKFHFVATAGDVLKISDEQIETWLSYHPVEWAKMAG